MLQNHATLSEIRKYLQEELALSYSGGEITALLKLILEHIGHPSPEPFLNPELRPGPETVAQINEIVRDIHTMRPIQYILGETKFLDLTIRVNEHALIPRPETEEMVHRIIKTADLSHAKILDLCTGSGCIALALKKAFPDSLVTGLDKSTRALELAHANGKDQRLEVEWLKGDLLLTESIHLQGKFDLLVSNPPYVRMSEKTLMAENVLNYEPHLALFVQDEDPLAFYKAIARLAPGILSENGCIWLEINESFGEEVRGLMEKSGFTQTIIHKDIHEKERFIEARK